jgi:putative transposase
MSVPKVVKQENLQKTCSRSSRYLWQDITECAPLPTVEEDEKLPKPKKNKSSKIPAGKTQRIRLFPTQEEKLILRRWMGTARWTYNRCLVAVEKEGIARTKKALRAQCLNAANFNNTELKWVLETPYDIRDEAMNDLLKSYSTNFAAKRTKFKIKFRSKKDRQQSIAILSKHWGKSRGVYAFICKMKSAENLPAELHYDTRLVLNRLGKFYLCIPQPLEIWAENQGPTQSEDAVIALDPGVRTFMTGYDPSGRAIEWGKNDISRIYRLSHIYDKIQSKRDSIHGKVAKRKRYKLRKVMLRIHQKIHSLINDCHHKLAKWLCQNYRVILLPEFKTQGMVRRGKRRIRSKTARMMLTWSHFRFRQFLLHKIREYPWYQVIVCTEEYTSKTCGSCGHIHRKLGGSKVFRCPSCAAELDRDINGARNILLRYLTLLHSKQNQEPVYAGAGTYPLGSS